MKYKRILAGLCAALLLAGSLAALPGCSKDETVTPPGQTNDANNDPNPPQDEGFTHLTEKEAAALAQEKLPEGYTLAPCGLIDEKGGSVPADEISKDETFYYAFDVHDPEENRVGGVAIEIVSGDRFSYNGGTGENVISEYADFPLYDAATDAQCDWNGIFQSGETTVELMQADNNSFEFAFSDGTQGFARVKGNTAATTDGKLTFTMNEDDSLLIGGETAALAGSYTKTGNN